MSTFADMKKNTKSQYDKLVEETNKMQSGGKQSDERFWYPTVDDAGNGSAIIRFLPAVKGEDLPWVRLWTHGFQKGESGPWYIENSLTTIGKDDPVSEYNTELWNNGTEAGKKQARKQKRRLGYIANILVIKDPKNPSNEGNVFLYKFGAKIFDKINDLMHPEFEDEDAVNPFDFWEGSNFRMKIRNVDGYRNYDKCEFDGVSLLDDDVALEAIWNKEQSLTAFVAPKEFKTYAELKAGLVRVLGTSAASTDNDTMADDVAKTEERLGKKDDAPKQEVITEATGDSDDDDWLKSIQNELED
jgi:hypothetical protein